MYNGDVSAVTRKLQERNIYFVAGREAPGQQVRRIVQSPQRFLFLLSSLSVILVAMHAVLFVNLWAVWRRRQPTVVASSLRPPLRRSGPALNSESSAAPPLARSSPARPRCLRNRSCTIHLRSFRCKRLRR